MKVWIRPELVVMRRGTANEAVLTFCKASLQDFVSGPAKDWCVCKKSQPMITCADRCESQQES